MVSEDIVTKIRSIIKSLFTEKDIKTTWVNLAKVVLVKMTWFNARRPNELAAVSKKDKKFCKIESI